MGEAKNNSEIPVRGDSLGKRFSHGNVNTKKAVIINEKSFTCNVCKKRYQCKYHLIRHLKVHTGEKPYECDICKKKFLEKYYLKSHMRSHTKERPYVCIICKKAFLQSSHLRSHMNLHTGIRFECDICKRMFAQKAQLKCHMRTHTQAYECSICESKYAYKAGLEAHMRRHTGKRPYECIFCKKAFFVESSLKIHMRLHTGKEKSKKCFECNICTKTCALKEELISHMRIHISESKHLRKEKLRVHMINHTGETALPPIEKPYECIFCKKRFILHSQLKHHIGIHDMEKPYECNVCKENFSQESYLNWHMKIHASKSDDVIIVHPESIEKSKDTQLGSYDESEFSCVKEEISGGFDSDSSSNHVRESHYNSERCLEETFPVVDPAGLKKSGDGSSHLMGMASDRGSGNGYSLKSKTEGVHQSLQILSEVVENVNNDGNDYRNRIVNIVSCSGPHHVTHAYFEHNEQQQQLPIRDKESECREIRSFMYKDLDWIRNKRVGHNDKGKRQNEWSSMASAEKMDDKVIKEHSMLSDSDGESNDVGQSGNNLYNYINGFNHIPLQSYNSLGENSNINRYPSCLKRSSQTNVRKVYEMNSFPFSESGSDSSVMHTYPVAVPQKYPVAMHQRYDLRLFDDAPAAWEKDQNEDVALANYLENQAVNEFMEM